MKQRSRSTQTEITFIHFSLLHIRIVHDPNWMSFSRSNLKHYNSLSLPLSRFAVALRFAFRCVCLCLSCSKWHSEFNNEEKLHKPQRRRKKTWAIRVKVNVFRLPATVWVLRSMAILKLCFFTFSVAHNDDIAVSLSLFGVFLFPWIINCVSTVPNSYIVAHRAHRAEGGKEKKRNEK